MKPNVLLIAVLAFTLAGLVSGKYEKLDESKDVIEAFEKPASFDILENWNICSKNSTLLKVELPAKKYNHDKAFEDALKLLPKEGGTLKLEKGTYLVSRPVVLPENSCLIGAGMSKTIIRLAEKSTPFKTQGDAKGILSCSKNSRVSIIALTVDGNKNQQNTNHKYYAYGRYGVSAERCNYFWTRNVRSTGSELYGFFTRGVKNDPLYHAFHEACVADGNGLDGIELRSVFYSSVYNSIVRNNKGDGISIGGRSAHNMIKYVRVSNSGANGIRLWKSYGKSPEDNMIQNVYVDESERSGIYMDSATDTVVKGGHITAKKGTSKSACYKVRKSTNFRIANSGCDGSDFEGMPDTGESKVEGIASSGAFCKLECGTCGGSNCAKMGKDKSCCISDVKKLKKTCDAGPPCTL